MSLINDALKKAQAQRADTPAKPLPSITSTPYVAKPATKPSPPSSVRYQITEPIASPKPPVSSVKYGAHTQNDPVSPKTLWLCLGAIAFLLAATGVTMLIMRPTTETAAVAKPTLLAPPTSASVPTAPAPIAQVETPSIATKPTAAPITPPAPTVAQTASAEPAPAPIVALPPVEQPAQPKAVTPAPVQATAKPVSKPVPQAVAAAPAAAALPPLYAPRQPAQVNPSIRIQNFIDRLRVSGIRMSDTGSKVILNDRLFLAGETVDANLELKLVKIEQGVLTFTDNNGKKYIKLFQ